MFPDRLLFTLKIFMTDRTPYEKRTLYAPTAFRDHYVPLDMQQRLC